MCKFKELRAQEIHVTLSDVVPDWFEFAVTVETTWPGLPWEGILVVRIFDTFSRRMH